MTTYKPFVTANAPWSTADLVDEHPNLNAFLPGLENFGGHDQFYGPVVLVKCFEDNSLIKKVLNSSGVDQASGLAQVLVVDAGASLRCAMLGDQIAQAAVDNGWAGVVINGCVRDSAILKDMPLGILALASTPQKSVRCGQGLSDLGSIHLQGVAVYAHTLLYADSDGVLVESPNHVTD